MNNTYSRLIKKDLQNPNNFLVYDDLNNLVFQSTKFTEVYDNVNEALKQTGGQIYFKNGIYEVDNPSWGGPILQWGVDQYPNTRLHLKGERGTKITLKDSEFPEQEQRHFATFACNAVVEDIDFDYKNKIIHGLYTNYEDIDVEICKCRFQNAGRFLVGTGPNVKRAYIHHNWFGPSGTTDSENGIGNDDQAAVSSKESSVIMNNTFDRTVQNGFGSSITTGSTKIYMVKNNFIFRKPVDIHHGISAEGDLGNFEYIDISGNYINNGTIAIGHIQPEYVGITYDSINICENTLIGGIIKVHGSNHTNWDNNQFKNINVSNNKVIKSQEYGIYLLRVSGMTRINNNQLIDSNMNNLSGQQYAPITVEHTRNVAINDNNILIKPISGLLNSSPSCVALYGDNSFVTFDNNTLVNLKQNTPFIRIWGNNNWIAGNDNKYRNPNSNTVAVYMNGSGGNTFDVTGGKTKSS